MSDSVMEALRDKENLNALATQFRSEFAAIETARRGKELEWAEDLRQCKGIYDPEEATRIAALKGSSVYVRYTRSKEVPLNAKIISMLFPSNDTNWDIDITPKPHLTDAQLEEVAQLLAANPQPAGERPDFEKAQRDYARQKADNMRQTMADQLVDLKIHEIDKKVIKSAVRYGTGIKKGILAQTVQEVETILDKETGKPKRTEKTVKKPYCEYVPIWNWYPDMSVTDYSSCRHSYELHSLSKSELRALARRNDFWGDDIREYISEHKDGDYTYKNWEVELQNISTDQKGKIVDKKYEVLERYGWVDGRDLKSAGLDISDKELDDEFYSVAWILGNTVIKLTKIDKHPSDKPIYHIFYLEKDESSIFGSGLPRSIRDTQLTICAATRAMLDNAAAVAGPILEVNTELLEQGEDPHNISPRRTFIRVGRGGEAAYPALRAYDVNSHIAEYISITENAKRNGDEESSFPAMIFGEPISAGNETVGGMSIRASNMNVTIGDVVKNFDDMNAGFLKGLYAWNMDYDLNPDPEIKGDAQIIARGFSSLLSKEVRTKALDYFASTLVPQDEPHINRNRLLRERAKIHDLDAEKIVRTEAEAQALVEAGQDREAAALAKAKLEAEIRYDHAKASKMEAGAESTKRKDGLNELSAMSMVAKTEAETDEKKTNNLIRVTDAMRQKGKGGKGDVPTKE